MTLSIRHDWTTEEIQTLLELPLMELLWQAQPCIGKPTRATGCSWPHC